MKKSIAFVIFIISCIGLKGQQLPNYTQYMFNQYVINPALAGTKNFYEVRSNSRFQWVGMVDPPQTICLSIAGPHSRKPMGFGAILFNDITGPTSRTAFYGSYAYNIKVTNDIRFSMGLSLGLQQNKVDGTKLQLLEEDLMVKNAVYSSYSPDATVGLYAYEPGKWYAGFSAMQLFGNTLKMYDESSGLSKLKRHFYLIAGYYYRINSDFFLEPNILLKGADPTPLQVDVSCRVLYKEMVWGGLSVRSGDAASFLLGYIHQSKFYFGYSYDFGISEIRRYNNGTHELMIGITFYPVRE